MSGHTYTHTHIHSYSLIFDPNHWAASVAQWLEHLSGKQSVVGSNPTRVALFSFYVKKKVLGLVAKRFFSYTQLL